jgi:hypothetical protein
MSNPTPNTGLWRLLVLDRDPADPKWLLATITLASDVRPALLDTARCYPDLQAAAEWVAASVGRKVQLTPVLNALAWHVRESGAS